MEWENRENFQGLSYSRRDLFENEEKEALLPLPETQYEYLERKTVKVSQDFSFTFDKVHYSMTRLSIWRWLGSTMFCIERGGMELLFVHGVEETSGQNKHAHCPRYRLGPKHP